MSNIFSRLLAQKPYLIADGAIATNLFSMGLPLEDAPELWNIKHPERIAHLAQRFIDAGSDILLTNSFGGTCHRLKRHGLEDKVAQLNIASVSILKKLCQNTSRDIIIAGSMGPTGEALQPLGDLSYKQALLAFKEQAQALKQGGADLLWIETMSDLEETKAACEAAASTGLPIVYTMSIDASGRTMTGVTPAQLVEFNTSLDQAALACGTNCGVGAGEAIAAIANMKSAARQLAVDLVLIAKANCGLPEYIDGEFVYAGTPELMAEYAKLAFAAGASIIGGCCGTTPEHIACIKNALATTEVKQEIDLRRLERLFGPISERARNQLNLQP